MKFKYNIDSLKTLSVLFSILSVLLFTSPALADHTMQGNINMVADEMARWSKQCGAKPLTPEAQAKLSELLIETSQLLKQIAAHSDQKMQGQYHQKVEKMKAEWDPFDSFYGN
ncbi:MAG: hypothetical protein QNJ61_14455 [Desulfobacterales bacterium]|nr:hypothetical protein [Desulfobacterales bacterium]